MSELLVRSENLSAVLLSKVLLELEQDFKRTKMISERFSRELNAICGGAVVVRACEYLDNNRVVRYCSDSARYVYKVSTRTLLPDVNMCTCEHFVRHVLLTQRALLCKHVLAVRIAEITARVQEERVTDAQLTDLLNMQFAHYTEQYT